MMRFSFAVPALFALAACDGASQQTAAPVNTAAAEADRALVARIEALPPGQLNMVLFRAIRDARQPCQGIAASSRIADQDGRPAWAAQCDRGDGKFLLVLNPDGQMAVTPGKALGQP